MKFVPDEVNKSYCEVKYMDKEGILKYTYCLFDFDEEFSEEEERYVSENFEVFQMLRESIMKYEIGDKKLIGNGNLIY